MQRLSFLLYGSRRTIRTLQGGHPSPINAANLLSRVLTAIRAANDVYLALVNSTDYTD